MTARWHVGPIEGADFWWVLVTSPEILVFLFFMITDPKTIPASRCGRRAYAVAVGLLATVLIAPHTTEFGTKVAVLGALSLVCATRGALAARRLDAARAPSRVGAASDALVAAVALAGALALRRPRRRRRHPRAAGCPARVRRHSGQALPEVTIVDSQGVAAIDEPTARTIARDLVADLRFEAEALRSAETAIAPPTAPSGEWLATLWQQIRDGIGRRARRPRVRRRADGAQPRARARPGPADGGRPARGHASVTTTANRADGRTATARASLRAIELRSARAVPRPGSRGERRRRRPVVAADARRNHARRTSRPRSACDFRQGAFRFGMSSDTAGDDGRRALLARLRRRRLARPLRRQLVRAGRHRRLGSARRACRGARSSATSTGGSRT